jgi:prepilin-type N-terminal cleavage/methylation domain-containing protein
MPVSKISRQPKGKGSAPGFSLLEMLVSIVIIVLLMSAVFPFLFQAQKRFQGNVVASEANQSARAALEVMSQEIGQAGYNSQFSPNTSLATAITTTGDLRCVAITNPPGITGIDPGDWVSVDSGANQELAEVVSTSSAATGPSVKIDGTVPATCTTAAKPWIEVKFEFDHLAAAPVISYKMPYGGGILVSFDSSGNLITTPTCASSATAMPCSLSSDQRLEFYGDINQDSTINYVVYSISPMVPATSVTINGTVYTLYNLYRSITPVPFPSLPAPATYVPACPAVACNNQASPMVEKVLYNATNKSGPTGLPIFGFPNAITVGVVPNQITVVGTIQINLCVAVNPQAMETGQIQWYSMATQIRPLNLTAAINVNNSNGGLYFAPTPKSLPMVVPTTYYP